MNSLLRIVVLGGMLVGSAAMAAPASVTFSHPEQFSDVPLSAWERERLLKQLGAHFDVLAERLPAGQTLKVEVLDVDLAGRMNLTSIGHPDLRILGTGADWPHMRLRFSVMEGERVLKSGEDNISNMAYLDKVNRYLKDDTLRYEKQMLDDWYKERVAAN